MADDGRVGEDDGGVGARARGGHLLTYRYRLGGGASDASGTIKAPSFADAARSLVRRRLARHLGAGPACLRLRAAGQEEVLYRVTPPGEGMGRSTSSRGPPGRGTWTARMVAGMGEGLLPG